MKHSLLHSLMMSSMKALVVNAQAKEDAINIPKALYMTDASDSVNLAQEASSKLSPKTTNHDDDSDESPVKKPSKKSSKAIAEASLLPSAKEESLLPDAKEESLLSSAKEESLLSSAKEASLLPSAKKAPLALDRPLNGSLLGTSTGHKKAYSELKNTSSLFGIGKHKRPTAEDYYEEAEIHNPQAVDAFDSQIQEAIAKIEAFTANFGTNYKAFKVTIGSIQNYSLTKQNMGYKQTMIDAQLFPQVKSYVQQEFNFSANICEYYLYAINLYWQLKDTLPAILQHDPAVMQLQNSYQMLLGQMRMLDGMAQMVVKDLKYNRDKRLITSPFTTLSRFYKSKDTIKMINDVKNEIKKFHTVNMKDIVTYREKYDTLNKGMLKAEKMYGHGSRIKLRAEVDKILDKSANFKRTKEYEREEGTLMKINTMIDDLQVFLDEVDEDKDTMNRIKGMQHGTYF